MKITKILSLLLVSITIFSSCSKEDVEKTTATVTINADGTLNTSDADGALYIIKSKIFDTHNSSTFDELHYATAWFGKFPALVNAGTVNVNSHDLDNVGNYYMSITLVSSGDSLLKPNNVAAWTVQGTSSVAAFNHTDNTPMPAAPSFTLPASININNSLTINHSATGGALGVLYRLTGDKGDTTKFVANSSSSITFSSAEIKSVAISNSGIALEIMPVTYSTAIYGGKKYYFVKQHQYGRETATQ